MIKKNVNPAYLLFFLASIGYFVKYGLNVFLAHHLKDDMYGNYSIAIKLLAIFVTLSLFGTNISANRFLANYLQLNKKVKAADFIAWNIKLTSVTFTISCILGFFTFGLMILLHFFGIHNIQQYHLSIYMLWVVPISAIATQLTSFALCEQRFYRSTFFSQVLQYALMLFFFMLVTLLLGWKLTNVTIVAVIFASYLTLAVIIFIFMKIEMVLMIKAGLKNIFMPLSADNAWLKVSSRLIANTMVFKILSVSDLIIVLLLVKSGLEVGHYAAVLMIISSIWLIPQNLYREVKPKISSLIETAHGRAQLQEKLDRVNIVVFPVIFSLCIVIICFSKTFLSHFGPSYLSANPALIILTIGVSFSATLHIASVLLTYAGFERLILILNCVELLMMIVLVIPATYFFNITGTAAATAFVMCTKSIIAVYAVRKHLGLRPASLF